MPDTLTLYDRTDALKALDALIAEADGEITPEQEAELAALEGAWTEKAEAVAAKRQELTALAGALEAEALRLTVRAQKLTKRAQWLEGYLLSQMTALGHTKVEGQRFTITRTLNPPKATLIAEAPALRADVDALPPVLRDCVTITPPQPESYAWNRAALIKAAKDHPDAVAGVALIDRAERVTIK